MADLITHALTAALLRGRRRPDGVLLWLILGVILPDLSSRAPVLAAEVLQGYGLATWVPLSDLRFLVGMNIAHTPVGIVGVAVVLAALLPCWLAEGRGRLEVVSLLAIGGALHLAVDVMQRHLAPGYYLLYPASVEGWELGWFRSDGSALAVPVLTVLWLALSWKWLRNRPSAASSSTAPDQATHRSEE
jgi:hypothetical protein